jgi:hypothetical protein
MGRDMQTLKVWPNGQWEREQERQDIYGKDANQIDFLAKQSTQRQLLSYKIFPEPKDDSQFIFTDFGRQFRNAVDQLIAAINAGDCPTPDELDQFKRGSQARRSLSRNLSEVDAAIEDNLCREKAERAAVYVRPEKQNVRLCMSGRLIWMDTISGESTDLPRQKPGMRLYGIAGTRSWPIGS